MELKDLVAFMKAERCLKVKMGGLEVELAPSAFPAPAPVDSMGLEEGNGAPTDDELIRWSVPGAFMEKEDMPNGK